MLREEKKVKINFCDPANSVRYEAEKIVVKITKVCSNIFSFHVLPGQKQETSKKRWQNNAQEGRKHRTHLKISRQIESHSIRWPRIPCNSVEQEIKGLFHIVYTYKFLLPKCAKIYGQKDIL